MNSLSSIAVFFLGLSFVFPFVGAAATRPDVDPCRLIAKEKVFAAFPSLETIEKQTIGSNTTCNYLNKYGLSGMIVSVNADNGIPADKMMESLGDGYKVEDVAGLGRQAAMAITLPVPEYGIAGGSVAELYSKKGTSCLLLAPVRLQVAASGPTFEILKKLAAEMLQGIP